MATCRSRIDESRRWSPTIRVFSRDKSILGGRHRIGLNSSGNGGALASRFSVSIALRQMEMPPSIPFTLSHPSFSLSLYACVCVSFTIVGQRHGTTKLCPDRIDLSTCYRKHQKQPWPTDSLFLYCFADRNPTSYRTIAFGRRQSETPRSTDLFDGVAKLDCQFEIVAFVKCAELVEDVWAALLFCYVCFCCFSETRFTQQF